MTLNNDEYKIEGNGIWISKDALESLKVHYCKVADKYKKEMFRNGLYLGKAEVVNDLLHITNGLLFEDV